ncbi:hypothetical protein N7478_001696 [Penicillium angulare]|uniref:uncharacterized protein n=1 Tax=Penicillium angulare TaxID=116970 RepID=UPI002540053E|nr:uncharacterized protein N7478_001696 [Penicillium angulare]KAJ5288666.1 hypothetical protein N7478_001696 [Penicillium angulare]
MDSLDSLRHTIHNHPLIDNHAHNLLNQEAVTDYDNYPLESIISEAHGQALKNAQSTLPLIRATNQLSELYGTPCSNWSDVLAARDRWVEQDYEGFVQRSLEGTHALLLDDLLMDEDDEDVEPYAWHDSFTASATKRIVRIEALAASLLKTIMNEERDPQESIWNKFRARFLALLEHAMDDSAVVGFKSVICYRTGLDIDPHRADEATMTASLHRTLDSGTKRSGYRIEDKPLNDWLVHETLQAITLKKRQGVSKPLQFHTGLGDNDISLIKSNPAYMQPLIARYSVAEIVLLHSSYPFTREAGYLASVYPNVYLDLGEVFPMVSREAQEQILRQSLELTPINRLLWSTDGHFHPETFWLANKQFRQALEKVFVEYVQHGDFNVTQAKSAVADILFHNSNRLYQLNLDPEHKPGLATQSLIATNGPSAPDPLNAFLQKNPDIKYIWMQWVDYTATLRVRMFPVQEFILIVRRQRRVGISLSVLNMLQDDTVLPEGSATGQFYMEPDLNSLYINGSMSTPAAPSATVMTFWRSEDDKPLEGCPRTTLQNIVDSLHTEHKIDILCGFEIEVVFLKPQKDPQSGRIVAYEPATSNHSWSQMTGDTRGMVHILEEITQVLSSMDIELQQFHAESAPGQFEFVLPPAAPLDAVDALYTARQVVTAIAEKHGLRATLHPRPFPSGAGSASHTHISINPATREDEFLAGILDVYCAITAFTLAQDASYERIRSGIWAGSEWVAWGFQNRETPIRKISEGHWEFKSMDGLANPYLAVAAILAGGYWGLSRSKPLVMKDCAVDAATVTTEEREKLGIKTRVPRSLSESLRYLQRYSEFQELLGSALVRNYISVKVGESARLAAMSETERRMWLLEKY